MYIEHIDSYRARFNSGYADGADDRKSGLKPISDMDNHPDPVYAAGYRYGAATGDNWFYFLARLYIDQSDDLASISWDVDEVAHSIAICEITETENYIRINHNENLIFTLKKSA